MEESSCALNEGFVDMEVFFVDTVCKPMHCFHFICHKIYVIGMLSTKQTFPILSHPSGYTICLCISHSESLCDGGYATNL